MRALPFLPALTVLWCLAFALPAQAANLPDGTYRATCSNCKYHRKTDTLACMCKTSSKWSGTTELRGVARCKSGSIRNNDGMLECEFLTLPAGSYTRSCTGCALREYDRLYCACCKDPRGDCWASQLDLSRDCRRIDNINGQLRCTR